MAQQSKHAKHNHGPNFGRRVAGCPRCDQLIAGAPAIQWQRSRDASRDAQQRAEIRDHFASHKHRSGGCGTVCTFGEW